MAILSNLAQVIPCTADDMYGRESHALELLPTMMRTPIICTMGSLIAGNLTLSGVQALDTISGYDGAHVMVWQQTNRIQNGVWIQQTGAWIRLRDPAMKYLQTIAVPQQNTTQTQYGFYFVTSHNPLHMDKTPITIERLGDHLFTWHMQIAEDEIRTDLDRGQKPILLEYLQDPRQLRKAKIFKTFEVLYRQAAANSQDGMPDRHERLSREYAKMYTHEMNTTTLHTQDAARIKARSVKVLRS